MMLGLLFALGLLTGSALAAPDPHHDDSHDDCCSAEDRREIAHIWHRVWASSFTDRKVAIAGAVFDDLFEHYPEAKKVFEKVDIAHPESGTWRSHLVRVANGLDLVINMLDDTQVLNQQLTHLASQHAKREGLLHKYFDGIQGSFERVLTQVASCFNVDAWNRCFKKVTNAIAHDLH